MSNPGELYMFGLFRKYWLPLAVVSWLVFILTNPVPAHHLPPPERQVGDVVVVGGVICKDADVQLNLYEVRRNDGHETWVMIAQRLVQTEDCYVLSRGWPVALLERISKEPLEVDDKGHSVHLWKVIDKDRDVLHVIIRNRLSEEGT